MYVCCVAAARNRLNASVEGVAEGSGLSRPLSKSTGELSSPTRDEGKDIMEPHPPRPMTSTGSGSSVPQLAERLSMAQKTHSILTALKVSLDIFFLKPAFDFLQKYSKISLKYIWQK